MRHYVGSKSRLGRPSKEEGTTPLSKSESGRLGAKALWQKKRDEQGEAPPRPSAFYFEGGEIKHSRCKKALALQVVTRTKYGEEALFHCTACMERVTIPFSVLPGY